MSWLERPKPLLTQEEADRIEEELIARFGKKGADFTLCRCPTATMCQNQENRKRCWNQKNAPEKFKTAGHFDTDPKHLTGCIYALEVRDGLIWF